MQKLNQALLNWYDQNKRDLPWRKAKDPYWIWLSEVMLQQTQVKTVLPYFEKFIQRYPKISDLAQAQEEEVLGLWSGLGYYRRARNMLAAAKILTRDGFPQKASQLRRLPGIGAYSSAAIASIAFDEKIPVVDGNVLRLFARLFALKGTYKSKELYTQVLEKTQFCMETLQEYLAGDLNQAFMEQGALICTPKSPNCSICSLKHLCLGKNKAEQYPEKSEKKPFSQWFRASLILEKAGKIYLFQRPKDSPWLKEMWGPLELWFQNRNELKVHLEKLTKLFELPSQTQWKKLPESNHTITRNKIKTFSFHIHLEKKMKPHSGQYFSKNEINKIAIANLDKKILPGWVKENLET